MKAPQDDAARISWIALARAPRIGPVTFCELLDRYGSPDEVLRAMPSISADREAAARELEATRALGGDLLVPADPLYPEALAALSPPPPVLSIYGKADLFTIPGIALVGARDASAAGRKIARQLASGLGEAGFITVSGGIDGEVHAASLNTGTIAVLAGGVDQVYPPQHRDLYQAIAEKGVIVSERAFGHRATARDFPRRNRIITGLAAGTVVIEAAERSGSLISARMAGEQGREVMAVPGSPLDPRAAGQTACFAMGRPSCATLATSSRRSHRSSVMAPCGSSPPWPRRPPQKQVNPPLTALPPASLKPSRRRPCPLPTLHERAAVRPGNAPLSSWNWKSKDQSIPMPAASPRAPDPKATSRVNSLQVTDAMSGRVRQRRLCGNPGYE